MVSLTNAITAALRQEIEDAIHEEREARIHETKELRMLCEISQKAIENLSSELESERLDRCTKDADLHARLSTEVSSMASQMELQMAALREELAEQRFKFKEEIKCEHELHKRELNEVRATLEATWRQMVRRSSQTEEMSTKIRYFQDEAGNRKEFIGDHDDMCTLYDLAKDAVDQATRVDAGLAQERRSRSKQFDKLRKCSDRFDEQFKELFEKMHRIASYIIPKSSRTLAQLVEKDAKWNLFLADPDGLFNKDDVVDAAYAKYLGDVLPLMIKHKCTFKVAIRLLADRPSSTDPDISSVKSCEDIESFRETESFKEFEGSPRTNIVTGSEISTDVDLLNLDAEDKRPKGFPL